MRQVTITKSASGATDPVILDYMLTPANTLLAVEFGAASATAQVEYTPDNPYSSDGNSYNSSANWFIHPVLVGLTANGVDQLSVPARAVRLNLTAYTSGTVTLQVVEAGVTG